jgi:hypothetical protein
MVKWLKSLFGSKPAEVEVFAERHKFVEEQQALSTPWAMFEVTGFEDDGRVKVEFNWNKPFINVMDQLGFTAETEEDTVQLFFYASQMKPTSLELAGGDETVQSEDLPQLSANTNRMVS